MLKTYKDLGLTNKSFFQGDDIVLSIAKAKEINSASLKSYIDNGYSEEDFDIIQKTINYTVVRWIKTDRSDKNVFDSYKRWRYVKQLILDYNTVFPNKMFNTKSYDKMKTELIECMFK